MSVRTWMLTISPNFLKCELRFSIVFNSRGIFTISSVDEFGFRSRFGGRPPANRSGRPRPRGGGPEDEDDDEAAVCCGGVGT